MTQAADNERPLTLLTLGTESTFGLTELRAPSGLRVQITPSGAIYAIRQTTTLINQFIPGPAEDGLCRLIVRYRSRNGNTDWAPLIGPTVSHRQLGPQAMEWSGTQSGGVAFQTRLTLHPDLIAWSWRVLLENTTDNPLEVDVMFSQDLGLADEAAVRNNEAFNSQYIDLLPVEDERLGWTILARQNQEDARGRHPWLAVGCEHGAAAFCTDGSQFFGMDHRLVGVPAAVRTENLPSRRLQSECALAGLQSRPANLSQGASTEVGFLVRFVADHPEASSEADLARIWETKSAGSTAGTGAGLPRAAAPAPVPALSLFVAAPWLHGDRPEEENWTDWFPGPRRHEEWDSCGRLLAFFHGSGSHVVSRDKESDVARPHGHILRSGAWRWIDNEQLGTTCYAAGIFAAQTYFGNPTFGRLLPIVRSALGLGRATGQRVFVRRHGIWHQLGIPSAFVMTTADVRWIYLLGTETIEARVWCSPDKPAAYLELKTKSGDSPAEFLVTHTVSLDVNEFNSPGRLRIHHDEAWVACEPAPTSMVGRHIPGTCYGIACADPEKSVQLGSDEMVFPDGFSRGHPCVSIRTGKESRFGVILCGATGGPDSLRKVVGLSRQEWADSAQPSAPPTVSVRLSCEQGPRRDVARLDEALPWLNHNAAIHFSAPHGLEQQSAAAWGVRDVCQGSVEWLLAGSEWPLVRRILHTVFAQQYAQNGSWPQWFMHPPYQTVQQAQSHGDVCFWPIKALCDYVEASNDLSLLDAVVGYTDSQSFRPAGPRETILQHCDRVIDHCESRFASGTSLVNFGDGDWDDSLQPANPQIRSRMVSSWTVALVYHAFRQLAEVCRRADESKRAARLEGLLERIHRDFRSHLMPSAVVAGFLVTNKNGDSRPLLHPLDTVTGIRYRLLPMTRAILAELFTPEDVKRHLTIIDNELVYPDGARLMSEPALYRGGREYLFKRAYTAANVGREIGLQYVHAHLRYAEAMAKVGNADHLWTALQVANPVGLCEVLPNAMPRQSNVYFSSSDADFNDRLEAARRWQELRTGSVGVRGGWRLYSSGPGLFIHSVRASLLGLREFFGNLVFDPVIPRSLNGLSAQVTLCGRSVKVRYLIETGTFSPKLLTVNGIKPDGGCHEPNPYRTGGLSFPEESVKPLLTAGENIIEIRL